MNNVLGVQKHDSSHVTNRKWQYLITAIILLTGIVISIAVYFFVRHLEQQRMISDFNRASRDRIAAAQKTLDFDLFVLQAVHGFFNGSQGVSRNEFNVFVDLFLQNRFSIHTIEWVPRVLNSESPKFIDQAVQEGFADFQITELDKGGNWQPASDRNEYFPIFFIAPTSDTTAIMGRDLQSVPYFKHAMCTARDTGKCTLTGKVEFSPPKQ